jgi:opacity protein-like surface antigen
MKRFLIAMALVVFMAGAASAEGMLFGIKGGINMANLAGDDIDDNEMKMAFGGGIWMNYAFNEAFSLQPELLYMLKGADWDNGDYTIKLSYIDLNILAKYSIPMEGNFAPYLFAGPSLGMNISAKEEYKGESEDLDDVKSMDIGAMLGVGFDYMLESGGCISFDARYAMGLTTIDDSDSEDDVKTTGIMVMVGYGFAF